MTRHGGAIDVTIACWHGLPFGAATGSRPRATGDVMGVSRKGLVLAVIAVALGFVPATAHATTIEEAIRIEATVPTEPPPTRIEQAMRIAEAVATENLTALMKTGRGVVTNATIEQAMRTGEAVVLETLRSVGSNAQFTRPDPADSTRRYTREFGAKAPVEVGRNEFSRNLELAGLGRLSFAAKLEIRGDDRLGVTLQLEARATADANQEKPT